MSRAPVVQAAGCVVWRPTGDGIEVLVVHRPSPHDAWSLPKGKLHRGEDHRAAARREVHEETGVRGELGRELVEVRYETPRGEDKRVRWWAMRAGTDDGFEPNAEIDDRRWVALEAVPELVTWDTDRRVLAAFRAAQET